MFKLRSILQVDYLNRCIYFQTQKYTWSRLFKLMYLCSNSEVYRKQIFQIDVFFVSFFKHKSMFEVYFQHWCIYFETQEYTWSRLSKLMYISSHPEVYLKQTFNIDVFVLKLRSILEVDVLNLWIYVQTQKYIRSRFPK